MSLNEIASSSIGAVVVVLAWLFSHASLIKGILDKLPQIMADLEVLKANPSGDALAALERVAAKLEASVSPMAEPLATNTPATPVQASTPLPGGPVAVTTPDPTIAQ